MTMYFGWQWPLCPGCFSPYVYGSDPRHTCVHRPDRVERAAGLSEDDVDRIARRVVEIMSPRRMAEQ